MKNNKSPYFFVMDIQADEEGNLLHAGKIIYQTKRATNKIMIELKQISEKSDKIKEDFNKVLDDLYGY
jgi:penicillin-binding protein-related factor A (putative recombinase)